MRRGRRAAAKPPLAEKGDEGQPYTAATGTRLLLILGGEEGGEDGAGDAVVGAGDGAGDDAEGGHGVGGDGGGGGEEIAGEDGGHAGVLHAYFDADGATLGDGETGGFADEIAEEVAEAVVAGDDGEGEGNEAQTVLFETGMDGEDDATDDEGEAEDGDAGHDGLDLLEVVAVAQEVVEGATQGHGKDGDEADVLEHAKGIDFDLLACEPQDHEGCDDGREEGGDGGHAYGEGDVTVAEERHDVARYATGTTAYEDDAGTEEGVEAEDLGETIGNEGHDGELRQGAEEDIEGTAEDYLEVFGGEGAAHGEHDDAEDDGGTCSLLHPGEGGGEEPAQDGCGDDYP